MCPLGIPRQVANPGPEEPDAGNPHVRICEGGEGAIPLPYLDGQQRSALRAPCPLIERSG